MKNAVKGLVTCTIFDYNIGNFTVLHKNLGANIGGRFLCNEITNIGSQYHACDQALKQ